MEPTKLNKERVFLVEERSLEEGSDTKYTMVREELSALAKSRGEAELFNPSKRFVKKVVDPRAYGLYRNRDVVTLFDNCLEK